MPLYPRRAEYYAALTGIPQGPNSQIFVVDPQSGDDDNDGRSFAKPLLTLEAAYALCTTNQNDCILMVGGPTANALAASITWSKSYTHLVGMSSDVPGLGQRCRVTGSTTLDATVLLTVSGSGCIFKNIQFYNGADADADNGAVVVSGSRNHFYNCFIVGMQHATPAARAGSYSLNVSGQENFFERCTVGTDTIVRAAANAEMILSGSKNTFRDCYFMTYSETAGHGLVSLVNSAAGINFFQNCVFYSLSVNWAAPIDNAFLVSGTGATYYIDLGPGCRLIGVDGWADTTTRFYTSNPLPHASAGVPTVPTT